ncbi:YdbH domain-containing protein [Moritella sp. 36]|nr:YdbH domain-containing protein [Moritella sp. 36]
MSASHKTKETKNHVKLWVISLLILVLLSVALMFTYRERIIMKVSNHFSIPYGIKVARLHGLAIKFDMQQPFFIDKIMLEQVKLDVDYLQFEQSIQGGSSDEIENQVVTVAPILPALPDWIPDLHIKNVTVQGTNLPPLTEVSKAQSLSLSNLNWEQLDLNVVVFKEVGFRYADSNAEFGFSVWLQDQRLLLAKLNYVLQDTKNTDNQNLLKVQLSTDLSKLSASVNPILPAFNTEFDGIATLDVNVDLQQMERISLRFSLVDGAVSDDKQKLIDNADLVVDTELVLDDKGWLPELVNLNITDIAPITVTAKTCASFTALLSVEKSVCQPFSNNVSPTLVPIVITPELPLSLQVGIQERDITRWKVQAKQAAMTVIMFDSMSNNSLAVKMDELILTPQFWQSNWSLAVITNSRYFSELNVPFQVTSKGHVEVKPTDTSISTKLIVNSATLTAHKFKYSDISSENIKVSLLDAMTVNISNNSVLPFDFALSTASFNNQYQNEYKVDRFSAQHRGRFSTKSVSVNSDWQLDDVVMKSTNTVTLLNLTPYKVAGHWQYPQQAIPSLLTDKYPLPVGLYLPGLVENRLDYQLMLEEQQGYLTAGISGEVTANRSTYNDITATDINANWRCKIEADKPDLVASLNTNCLINSNISSVDMGPVVTNVNFTGLVTFANEQLQVAIDNASANAFSGTVSLSPLLITDFDHIVGQVRVRNLSLPEVLELYQVPGVKVTGLLKADLPFVAKGSAVSIIDGTIEQQGAGGVIQIKDNATIDQLKLTQPQLRYALELLENLHYDSLHSDVNFKPSGETKLTINIKGRNPSVERPIEFNYSHEENILQLFRSLRINDAMYDALDKMNNR